RSSSSPGQTNFPVSVSTSNRLLRQPVEPITASFAWLEGGRVDDVRELSRVILTVEVTIVGNPYIIPESAMIPPSIAVAIPTSVGGNHGFGFDADGQVEGSLQVRVKQPNAVDDQDTDVG